MGRSVFWFIATLLVASTAPAEGQLAEQLQGIVRVTSESEGRQRSGSGFVLAIGVSEAYILTLAHIVEGDAAPKVEFYARRNIVVPARVVELEPSDPRGLAVLLVEDGLPEGVRPLLLADAPRPGDDIAILGSPLLAAPWSVIKGSIASRQGRDVLVAAPVDDGLSGSPVIKDARVVAVIHTASGPYGKALLPSSVREFVDGLGIAFNAAGTLVSAPKTRRGNLRPGDVSSIPMSDSRPVAPLLGAASTTTETTTESPVRERIRDHYYGFLDGPVTDGISSRLKLSAGTTGVVVVGVTEGTPAAAAGLRTDDVITAIDGKPFAGDEEFNAAIRRPGPLGQKTAFRILRNGREMELAIAPTERLQHLERECNTNQHAASCEGLGYLYETARGVPRSLPVARELYEKACNSDPKECYRLARALSRGMGGPRDEGKAEQLFDKTCELGDMNACVGLADLKWNQGSRDGAAIASLYRKACDAGNANGCSQLAQSYARGLHGLSQDWEAAFSIALTSCNGGSSWGCWITGQVLERGRGWGMSGRAKPEQERSAEQYYQRACRLGSSNGCRDQAFLLSRSNVKDAVGVFRRECDGAVLADPSSLPDGCLPLKFVDMSVVSGSQLTGALIAECQNGSANICFILGQTYAQGQLPGAADGVGIVQSLSRATEYYEAACRKDLGAACNNVGILHQRDRELRRSLRWIYFLQRACDLQYAAGCEHLALAYETGDGVRRDAGMAAELRRRARSAVSK